MKKKTKFYALLLAMVLSLTQMIGAAVPVKAATKECSHGYTLVNGIGTVSYTHLDVYKRQVVQNTKVSKSITFNTGLF